MPVAVTVLGNLAEGLSRAVAYEVVELLLGAGHLLCRDLEIRGSLRCAVKIGSVGFLGRGCY